MQQEHGGELSDQKGRISVCVGKTKTSSKSSATASRPKKKKDNESSK